MKLTKRFWDNNNNKTGIQFLSAGKCNKTERPVLLRWTGSAEAVDRRYRCVQKLFFETNNQLLNSNLDLKNVFIY